MSSQLVTFTLAGAHFGIDMLRVHEALRGQARTPIPLAEPGVAGFINLRGQVVLTIDLRTRLGFEAPAPGLEPMMVVVEVDSAPVSLLVDEVGDVVDVQGRHLEAPPGTLPDCLREVMLGVYQLADDLLLALDLDRVVGAGASLSLHTQHLITQHSITQHSITQHSITQHSTTQHSITQHSTRRTP
jgi:purine-binding chemotaxis protein CheW